MRWTVCWEMTEETRPLPFLVGFGRALRTSGVVVGAGQMIRFARAVARLDPCDPLDLYWAGRACLLCRRADLPVYEREFRSYFFGHMERGRVRVVGTPPPQVRRVALPGADREDWSGPGQERPRSGEIGRIASDVERLRRKDFSECSEEELRALRQLMEELPLAIPLRSSRRARPASRGRQPDLRRTIRRSLRTEGELLRRSWRRRRLRRRRLVLFLDVSGSMAGYSRALLQFAHSASQGTRNVEVFCFGTRLTRLTDAMRRRDPDRALAEAAETVVDWEGGTRIGDSLHEFHRTWGRRSIARGAVILICSDGFERGEPSVLASQMARLARMAHVIVWVNPLKGDPRYEPLAGGMRAALPFVDLLVSGHNLASLEDLSSLLPDLGRTRRAQPNP